ncbi:DUF2397 family protein [Streptomyces sp. NPDC048357]|uniref:DUF2397 family protein n=1 Tax=Streptomyces sp. NPDC048357 TaxID=3154719 RepID=UPI003421E0DE
MTVTTTAPEPRPDGYSPFAHLTVQNTALYRQVMGVFVIAKERFAVHLRPEDVHAAASRPTSGQPSRTRW